MNEKQMETFCPASQQEWRLWLQNNHKATQSVWLIYYKKGSGRRTLTWSEAVDEAICFGWIDSTARPIDENTFMQFFCRRKLGSVWSKINKEKVKRLIENESMTEAGFKSIETAKQNGSWVILDEVEELKIPRDLSRQFTMHPGSKKYFMSLSRSVKKSILQWLVLAKLPATREKRISEIALLAAQQLKPKLFG